MVVWFAAILLLIAHAPADKSAAPPVGFFVMMPVVWLGWIGLWVGMLVVAIVYGVKAGRGEWAEYPVLGKLVRSILHIGPGGAAI